MLHIVNGAATLNLLDRTEIMGARVSGDDIFAEGPVVDRLETPASWQMRADYLQKRFNIRKDRYLSRNEERERSLRSFAYHEEVVLWFEGDMFCQFNLAFLLNWFAKRELGNTRLSLVSPEYTPGIRQPRALSGLNPKQLSALFADRTEVSRPQLSLVTQAWSAYSSPDPSRIEALLREGTEQAPALGRALRLHLQRFPSVNNGLNVVENKILEILAEGTKKFLELFSAASGSETLAAHGMGDVQFSAYLSEMAMPEKPLVRMEHSAGVLTEEIDRRNLSRWTVQITDLGRDILKRRADNIEARGLDRWYGGVRLRGTDSVWRWDSEAGKLVAPAQTGQADLGQSTGPLTTDH